MKRILVIGGYGNFGQFISKALAQEPNIQLIIAGRSLGKAQACCSRIEAINQPVALAMNIYSDLAASLRNAAPDIVIHTSGPFQDQGYQVAEACIEIGSHYIDLADGRAFVAGITSLQQAAAEKGLLICSGASSVPGLSSALIQHYQPQFHSITEVDYAISTAHNTSRGLATTRAVLSYAGKPFAALRNGRSTNVIGWRGTRSKQFWKLGNRLLGNCDIPDLALFPSHFPDLETIRFQAGLELPFIHHALATLAWLVQHRLCPDLPAFAPAMMALSRLFDAFGTEDSGFFMELIGLDAKKNPKKVRFDLIARQGDGLYIPTIPAIVVALKLARNQITQTGACACLGLVTLEEYLERLKPLHIEWQELIT